MMEIIRIAVVFFAAYIAGVIMTKIKMPAILGWLITGMVLGPYAFNVLNNEIMDSEWYYVGIKLMECCMGMMIGSELMLSKLKKTGKQVVITTFTQSIGTFLIVSLVFGIVFLFMDIPVYLAFIFGGIALATAPAPALSIVREYGTKGPVTDTLIPMAALDDIIGVCVFFTVIFSVQMNISETQLSIWQILSVIALPIIIGAVTGALGGLIVKLDKKPKYRFGIFIALLICSAGIGFFINRAVFKSDILNFMLIGMTYSAVFANMLGEEDFEYISVKFQPVLGVSMIFVILNLGAPLDYHMILGAGVFTFIYIISRAVGKYLGALFGSHITKAPPTVKKYLGLTLLPHSGVSLVFTGIAVSVLSGPAPECAAIVQGTIAAAAVINEIIAVIVARQAFILSGEVNKSQQ